METIFLRIRTNAAYKKASAITGSSTAANAASLRHADYRRLCGEAKLIKVNE